MEQTAFSYERRMAGPSQPSPWLHLGVRSNSKEYIGLSQHSICRINTLTAAYFPYKYTYKSLIVHKYWFLIDASLATRALRPLSKDPPVSEQDSCCPRVCSWGERIPSVQLWESVLWDTHGIGFTMSTPGKTSLEKRWGWGHLTMVIQNVEGA